MLESSAGKAPMLASARFVYASQHAFTEQHAFAEDQACELGLYGLMATALHAKKDSSHTASWLRLSRLSRSPSRETGEEVAVFWTDINIEIFLNLKDSKGEPIYYRLSIVRRAIAVWIDRAQRDILGTISALL